MIVSSIDRGTRRRLLLRSCVALVRGCIFVVPRSLFFCCRRRRRRRQMAVALLPKTTSTCKRICWQREQQSILRYIHLDSYRRERDERERRRSYVVECRARKVTLARARAVPATNSIIEASRNCLLLVLEKTGAEGDDGTCVSSEDRTK